MSDFPRPYVPPLRQPLYLGLLIAYILIVLVAVVAATEIDSVGVGLTAAIGTSVAFVFGVGVLVRRERQFEGVERALSTDATSIAFFLTMCGALTYSHFEQFMGAPKLSMSFAFLFTQGAWVAAWLFLRRKIG